MLVKTLTHKKKKWKGKDSASKLQQAVTNEECILVSSVEILFLQRNTSSLI